MAMGSNAAIELVDVSKTYRRGQEEVAAVRDLSLAVPHGEFLAIMGPSGSGKTTLLNLMAGLDAPTKGEVRIDGTVLARLSDDALTQIRRTKVGIVFQFFNLLPSVTAIDNVALPLRAAGEPYAETRQRAIDALAAVGLAERANHLPAQLSGGEMQRVAIARALAIQPAVILADEPTGNLDSFAGGEILSLLRKYNRERAVTVALVTHSHRAATYADRVVTVRDGRIEDDVDSREPKLPPRSWPLS